MQPNRFSGKHGASIGIRKASVLLAKWHSTPVSKQTKGFRFPAKERSVSVSYTHLLKKAVHAIGADGGKEHGQLLEIFVSVFAQAVD